MQNAAVVTGGAWDEDGLFFSFPISTMPDARALVLDQNDDRLSAAVQEVAIPSPRDGEVLVSVRYSSLNYKDALAVTGRGKVIRGAYPFVPGIDLVGEVEESRSPSYRPGDPVIVTGWGIGEDSWGGYAEKQCVDAGWIVPLPAALSMQDAMTIGTAGFTAMLAVMALEEQGLAPEAGETVVTGASGGAGSFAVALLAAIGHTVTASTGSRDKRAYLQELGAAHIADRSELADPPGRPLETARWSGAVDTVGGDTLARVLSQIARHGSAAAVGNAGGHRLNTTVFPFILRGVSLLGIDSNACPPPRRRRAWERLTETLSRDELDRILNRVISLSDVPSFSQRMLDNETWGRIVVDVTA